MLLDPADDTEQMGRPPLETVVIGAIDADRAEVGHETAREHGVRGDHRPRHEIEPIEQAAGPDDEPQQETGQRRQHPRLGVDGAWRPGPPLADLAADPRDRLGKGRVGPKVQLDREQGRADVHGLLGGEREPDAAPLIEPPADDEPIEPGLLVQRRRERVQHELKQRRFRGRPPGGVERRERRQRAGEVDRHLVQDERLGTTGHEIGHDRAHGRHVADQITVGTGEERHPANVPRRALRYAADHARHPLRAHHRSCPVGHRRLRPPRPGRPRPRHRHARPGRRSRDGATAGAGLRRRADRRRHRRVVLPGGHRLEPGRAEQREIRHRPHRRRPGRGRSVREQLERRPQRRAHPRGVPVLPRGARSGRHGGHRDPQGRTPRPRGPARRARPRGRVHPGPGAGHAVASPTRGAGSPLVEAGTGKRPIIYTGFYVWRDQIGDPDFSEYPLWIAAYVNRCPDISDHWNRWTFWQTSDSGRIPGIDGNVDTDLFNGDLAALQRLADGGGTPYGARFEAQSFPYASEVIPMTVGDRLEGWFDLRNTGTETWGANTYFAPTPRDETGPVRPRGLGESTRRASPPAPRRRPRARSAGSRSISPRTRPARPRRLRHGRGGPRLVLGRGSGRPAGRHPGGEGPREPGARCCPTWRAPPTMPPAGPDAGAGGAVVAGDAAASGGTPTPSGRPRCGPRKRRATDQFARRGLEPERPGRARQRPARVSARRQPPGGADRGRLPEHPRERAALWALALLAGVSRRCRRGPRRAG
jgi:hypothetical protein